LPPLLVRFLFASPFIATLADHPQPAENPAALSLFPAAVTSRAYHNLFGCHSYKKQPEWGIRFARYIVTSLPLYFASRGPRIIGHETRAIPHSALSSISFGLIFLAHLYHVTPMESHFYKKQRGAASPISFRPMPSPPRHTEHTPDTRQRPQLLSFHPFAHTFPHTSGLCRTSHPKTTRCGLVGAPVRARGLPRKYPFPPAPVSNRCSHSRLCEAKGTRQSAEILSGDSTVGYQS